MVYFESHFDRFRPEVRQRWREQGGAGSGIWYDLGPHLIDQALQLFGKPQTLFVDLGELRPGSQSVDYFHAVLNYGHRRVVLHGTVLAAAETARYIVHGTQGSFIKYGLDPQEDRLKAGERLPQADWGYDMRDGVVTLSRDGMLAEQPLLTIPGNYPAYYAAIRDAISGAGTNPVPASEAIQVMEMIELGIESAKQQKRYRSANINNNSRVQSASEPFYALIARNFAGCPGYNVYVSTSFTGTADGGAVGLIVAL